MSGPVVEVYYTPANPAEACLNPGGAGWVAIVVAGVSLFTAFTAWVFANG